MTDEELDIMRTQLKAQLESLRRPQADVGMGNEAHDCILHLCASVQRALDDIERLIEARKERRQERREQ